jgi:flagellar FliJ protein
MAFRFSLASVLRLREIHEQREERLLTEILAQVRQTREALELLDAQIVDAAAGREARLMATMPVAELHAEYGMSALLEERRQFTQSQLAKFEQLRDKQIKTYQAAHQDRELLSNMREEQRASYAVERSRLEQKAVDDLFIARRRHR